LIHIKVRSHKYAIAPSGFAQIFFAQQINKDWIKGEEMLIQQTFTFLTKPFLLVQMLEGERRQAPTCCEQYINPTIINSSCTE